jgi:hypothetical protein
MAQSLFGEKNIMTNCDVFHAKYVAKWYKVDEDFHVLTF